MSKTRMAETQTAEATDLTIPVGAGDHVQGADDATVTLVEYADYQCPYCGEAYEVVKKLQKKMGGKLRFVFRNFPLSQMHQYAEGAAEAAEAANAQGKFWEMHDILFENQDNLTEKNLLDYGEKLGLDENQFSGDLNNETYDDKIHTDFNGGVESGVGGTPTFFINGTRYDGAPDYETMFAALQSA